MSGIILPGQGNQPESSGGIELPKGFSRRREEAEQAALAPDETVEQAASASEAPAGQRGSGQEFLFPPSGAQVQCPSCGTPYVVPVFTIIDLGVNPELLGALLGGQVNMAVCPNCGAGGPLTAPLMVHNADQEFLGVFTPPTGMNDVQRQKTIGDLTQALMRKLPTEQRRGYLLQPIQYMDWERFMEKLWSFQGVTPEMLRRQRNQMEALQSLTSLADDPAALTLALERYADLIDRQFFSLLDRLTMLVSSQGDGAAAEKMALLRTTLLEETEAGREIMALQAQVRTIIQEIPRNATREDVLERLVSLWNNPEERDVATSVALSLAPMLDYEFLLVLANRLDNTTDETERTVLEELRALIMDIQEQQRRGQQTMSVDAQQVLQAVLEAGDTEAAVREHADAIDEEFLALLAANIEQAERGGATAAVRRLQSIYEIAVSVLQEQMPEDLRLINELLNAPDKGAQRNLLEKNRGLLTRDFLDALRQFEADFRSRGNSEIANRLKDLHAQASLMI